jgi:hypothetical protein
MPNIGKELSWRVNLANGALVRTTLYRLSRRCAANETAVVAC